MRAFRAFQDGSQLMLLPPSIRDWVPADHEFYFLADVVEQPATS